jgi:hypothetical protein
VLHCALCAVASTLSMYSSCASCLNVRRVLCSTCRKIKPIAQSIRYSFYASTRLGTGLPWISAYILRAGRSKSSKWQLDMLSSVDKYVQLLRNTNISFVCTRFAPFLYTFCVVFTHVFIALHTMLRLASSSLAVFRFRVFYHPYFRFGMV